MLLSPDHYSFTTRFPPTSLRSIDEDRPWTPECAPGLTMMSLISQLFTAKRRSWGHLQEMNTARSCISCLKLQTMKDSAAKHKKEQKGGSMYKTTKKIQRKGGSVGSQFRPGHGKTVLVSPTMSPPTYDERSVWLASIAHEMVSNSPTPKKVSR
jgi:hypothetical protein